MTLSLEYIAGFFDGEGCIKAAQRLSREEGHPYIVAEITQKFPGTLRVLADQYGFALGCYGNHRIHRASLHGQSAISFLEQIEPHLVLKKRQSELARLFYAYQIFTWERGPHRRPRVSTNNLTLLAMEIARLKRDPESDLDPIRDAEMQIRKELAQGQLFRLVS